MPTFGNLCALRQESLLPDVRNATKQMREAQKAQNN